MGLPIRQLEIKEKEILELLRDGESFDLSKYPLRYFPPIGVFENNSGNRALFLVNPLFGNIIGVLLNGTEEGESRFFAVQREELSGMIAREEVVQVFP